MARVLICFALLNSLSWFNVCSAWEVMNSIKGGHGDVTASTNWLWSINSAQEIFRCARPCSGKWQKIDGSLKQIDASDEEVWGVNRNHRIYKRPVDGSSGWRRIGGGLKHVSASGNGYIWGVNSGDVIFRCKKPCTGQWKALDGRLKQVDGGYAYVYGVNRGGAVYSRPIDGSGRWRHIAASVKMQHVTASGKDDIFAVSTTGDTYRCKKPCIGEWEKMSTNFNRMTRCDASYDALFGVGGGGSILRHKTGK